MKILHETFILRVFIRRINLDFFDKLFGSTLFKNYISKLKKKKIYSHLSKVSNI